MNERAPHADGVEGIWYGGTASAAAMRAALGPLAAVFTAGVRVRNALYDAGIAATDQAPAPVVSVGALRVGGAGKTPFVLWLSQTLRFRGASPCLVTRGYAGNSSKGEPWILERADAETDPTLVERAGDEAMLLALRSGLPVAIGADRTNACRFAFEELSRRGRRIDLFLLDDGFQHRRLRRDLDIVLVSGDEQGERVLPAGPLREPVAALARADVVVEVGRFDSTSGRLRRTVSSPASGRIVATSGASALVASVADAEGEPLSSLAGRRVAAVAGIARPERFLSDLEKAGACIARTVLRRDHHRYDATDRAAIEDAARHADLVVTTEKDLVKLGALGIGVPLRALRIAVAITGRADEAALVERILALRAI